MLSDIVRCLKSISIPTSKIYTSTRCFDDNFSGNIGHIKDFVGYSSMSEVYFDPCLKRFIWSLDALIFFRQN